jgi:hypothetical protein
MAARFFEFQPFKRAGAFDFFTASLLPFLTSWLKVGIACTSFLIIVICEGGLAAETPFQKGRG